MRASLKISWNNELAIAMLFLCPSINYYIACLLDMNGLQTISTYVYMILYVVGVVSYLFTLRKPVALGFTIGMLATIGFSYLLNSDISQYMMGGTFFSSPVTVLLCVYFPVFLLMINEVDFHKLLNYLSRASVLILILAIIVFCGNLFIYHSTPSDYMSFAYMMLTPIILCFFKGWNNNRFHFLLAIIAAFILFIVGCRGAVVTLALYFALILIRFYMQGETRRKRQWVKLMLLLALIVIAVYADTILNWIGLGLQGIGFTSRTVAKLLSGNGAFIESEGRWSIWSQAIRGIGFFGQGLFGDRTVIIDEYGHATYAHNFLLEIIVDFGAIIGILFAIYFLYAVLKAVRIAVISKNHSLIKLTFAMISVLFAKHMISTSFLISFDFWFYFGLAMNIVIYRSFLFDGSNDIESNRNEEALV